MKEKSRIGTSAVSTVLVVAALGMAASPASGASLTPDSHDFGSQSMGTISAPQPFSLTAFCLSEFHGLCELPETIDPNVSIASPSYDFVETDNCPPTLVGDLYGVSCTINVRFIPMAGGARVGILTAATGYTAYLFGTGVVPAAPTQTVPAPPFELRAAIKRCKKKFPKGPKRKRCIKKAKQRAGA